MTTEPETMTRLKETPGILSDPAVEEKKEEFEQALKDEEVSGTDTESKESEYATLEVSETPEKKHQSSVTTENKSPESKESFLIEKKRSSPDPQSSDAPDTKKAAKAEKVDVEKPDDEAATDAAVNDNE